MWLGGVKQYWPLYTAVCTAADIHWQLSPAVIPSMSFTVLLSTVSFLQSATCSKIENTHCAHCAMSRPNLPLIRPAPVVRVTLDTRQCMLVSRLDFCPTICPLTIFSLSVSDWDTGYFAPNLDCCVTRCELLMTRCRWLVYCVAVWPPHQCSDLVWWNSAEILINGRPSSTALHSSQRLIEKFAGDYQDTKPDWVRTGLIISLVSMSYCHNLVFLVFKPNFFWW